MGFYCLEIPVYYFNKKTKWQLRWALPVTACNQNVNSLQIKQELLFVPHQMRVPNEVVYYDKQKQLCVLQKSTSPNAVYQAVQ